MKKIKCCLTGDDICGKNEILLAFKDGEPPEYIPPTFDGTTSHTLTVNNEQVNMEAQVVNDTPESSKKLRGLIYNGADVVILFFSLLRPNSLENIEKLWFPEIQEYCPDAPYILVGTEKIKRDTFSQRNEEVSNDYEPIHSNKGIEMKYKIDADDYIECSIESQKSIQNVFIKAAKLALTGKTRKEKQETLKIGMFSDYKILDIKNKIATKYILGYTLDTLPDEKDFVKIEEANNVIMNITVDTDNPDDLHGISAILYLFDAREESYSDLKAKFDDIQKGKNNKIPYALAIYFDNDEEISDDILNGLTRDFKCKIFRIRSFSDCDIEDVFFHLVQKISEKIIKDRQPIKLKRKNVERNDKKRKDKK